MSSKGTMLAAVPKFAASRRLKMAIGFSGMAHADLAKRLSTFMDSHTSQRGAMNSIASLAADLVADRDRLLTKAGFSQSDAIDSPIRLAIAIWSTERDQPEGYLFHTDAKHAADSGATVGRLWDCRRLVSPLPHPDYMAVPTADKFDPAKDILPLMQAQRRSLDWPEIRVGGAIDVVMITRQEVRSSSLRPWRDLVGRPLLSQSK